jgi:hypothetical protein
MDLQQLFLLRRQDLESVLQQAVLGGLAEAQLRQRPHPAANSIAWLLWHMARGEDWAINRIVMQQPQVLSEDDWPRRLGVALNRMGTSMNDAEVEELSQQVQLPALTAYAAAVRARTNQVAAALRPEEWARIPDPADLRQAVLYEGAFGEYAEPPAWLVEGYEPFYGNKPRAWFFTVHGLTHPYQHMGEAGLVRSMLLHPSTR